MKINFIIETSQEYFCNWLEDFTRNIHSSTFPTEKGYIALQTARPYKIGHNSNRYMRMEGFYLTPQDGESQMAYPISNVIEFKIIPLNQNRLEIIAECHQQVVEIYFRTLIEEIVKRWEPIKKAEERISELNETVINSFSELKQSQNALITIQDKLSQISKAIHDGQIEQGEISRTLDAIRRALRFMQKHDTNLSKEIAEQVSKANEIIDSKIDLQQKLELTIPILPLFLNYKAEFGIGTDVDIENLKEEIQGRLLLLSEKSLDIGGG